METPFSGTTLEVRASLTCMPQDPHCLTPVPALLQTQEKENLLVRRMFSGGRWGSESFSQQIPCEITQHPKEADQQGGCLNILEWCALHQGVKPRGKCGCNPACPHSVCLRIGDVSTWSKGHISVFCPPVSTFSTSYKGIQCASGGLTGRMKEM